MSGTVTPARRPREEEESEGEDYEISIDGEGSARSNRSKRARLDQGSDGGDDDEVSESGAGDLLPDSFRRSPKGKRQAQEYQPGSIVRVTLTNFVTYTKAEFHPGPNLNMVIGPNGTGKSTLVCAICLGLGWSTSHLGRAKNMGEFVKHGAKKAEIEIELAKDPERQTENPVITTRIARDGDKAKTGSYWINGKKSNMKGVQTFARSFSIQVDNLCQFLPQDRVVEFAALSPVDLLTQTQRAAAPEYMSDWHDDLKSMRKQQKVLQDDQQKTFESLKNDENRQRLQEADVVRLRERSELQERIAILEKLRPFPEYKGAKAKHTEAKKRSKEAQKELARLQRNLEPNLQAAKDKEHYLERIGKVVGLRERLVQRHETLVADNKKKIDNAQGKIDECATEIQAEKESMKTVKQSIPRYQQAIATLQRAMQTPPEAFDPAEMNEQIRDRTRRIREIEDRAREIREGVGSLNEQGEQRKRIIADSNAQKENLHSQAGQQANKLRQASREAASAWEWIQANRDKFQGEVFGPPIVECTVKDQRQASAVESTIQDGEKLAFTVTSQQDFRMLQHQLYTELRLSDVNIRSSLQPLNSFRASVSPEELQRYGLECYMVDLIEGPEAVLAMLCDNSNLHQTAYASREISEQQFTALQRSPISSWVTPTQSYRISRRREYGEHATSTRVQGLKPARFFTDMPVDHQREQELEEKIREAKGEIAELVESRTALIAEGNELKEKRQQLSEEKKEIEDDKTNKQKAMSEFNGLPVKEERARAKLEQAKEQLRGSKERLQEIIERGDAFTTSKGQLVLDYANSVEALRNLHVQLFEVEILRIEAKSDQEQLKAQHAEEVRLLQERENEVAELERTSEELLAVGKRLQDQCREIGQVFSDPEQEIYDEITNWVPEQLETEVQSVQARLEMTHGGGNENTLREFEERAKRIEVKRAKLNELDTGLENIASKITDLRGRWEPELDALIAHISEAFAENFARIQCAGEVAVHKDEDFEQWAIQIKVKFRENEALSVLDSHRQSGGERAVSTIFYLMALQSLARAPFRVVDEINQGMDPRNERLVHSRMVDIACAEHTSQYFLITPKLLNGLRYHPNMKVHCIASGEYMPTDHRELDFGALAKKAMAIRGGGSVSVVG
ncbi:Structural maintenance of chromosomes protein 5 [Vermiconidia calcicola]|uniref:Structural maintenance of chromosomes protein 5 n=1 Tax=Vermiconidia calcicola TaxID=1690605 RepID=A0ACC3NT46_9PEZI|nr:Structural maintenance of chromosomes protein 5 [Vermiconidia calcicola]